MLRRIALPFVCLAVAAAQTPAETREANLKTYCEMLRKDLRAESRSIFRDLMQLSADQETKFQPIYQEFERAFQKLAEERVTLVKQYTDSSRGMNDATAAKLTSALLDMEGRRAQLKRQTVDRIAKAVGPVAALRFLEIESQIEELMDLQANAGLPIVE